MDDEEGKYAALERKINTLIQLQEEQGENIKSLSVLIHAFPKIEGEDTPDIRGHYHYHVSKIKDWHDNKTRWNKIKEIVLEKAVSAGLIGAFFVIALGLQTWFTHWVGK